MCNEPNKNKYTTETLQVVMSRGQAHAPIFTAKLTVPQVMKHLHSKALCISIGSRTCSIAPMSLADQQLITWKGHTVTATGSSKKIAKNLAAKMMLDKLEEVGSRFKRNK